MVLHSERALALLTRSPRQMLAPRLARTLTAAKPGDKVKVCGWVSSVRKMKQHAFVDISDGSTLESMAAIMTPETAESLSTGACVELNGTIKASPGKQPIELHVETSKLLGPAGPEYPLQKKFHTIEYLRQLPEYRWKTRSLAQVLRFRSWALGRMQRVLEENDVVQVSTPVLTSSDCEGAGEVFGVKKSEEFFGKPVYLTVSSQLHLEVFCAALGRVWNVLPAFRAEASDTNRHLSEFTALEVELAFPGSLHSLIDFCELLMRSSIPSGTMAAALLNSKRDPEARGKLESRWASLQNPWVRITYAEAIEIIARAASRGHVSSSLNWGDDIPSEHERFLASKEFNSPVFVTDYPTTLKPFYMKLSDEQVFVGPTFGCFDLLFPDVGEVVGGSMREDNYDRLAENMKSRGMDSDALSWYVNLRKQGSFPHGGFGIGFDRLIMYLTGATNIRDVVGFIRESGHCPC